MKKPPHTPAAPRNELRRIIRLAMMTAAARPWTLEMLVLAVNELTPKTAQADEVQRAIDWNHDHGFVDFKHDAELELKRWFLTANGKTATT